MSTTKDLRLVLVTPEKTLLDRSVRSARLPLFDGSIGILPGRAPLIGRLGAGELRVTTSDGDLTYFIDGGFLQVRGDVVTVLTDRAVPVAELSAKDAEEELEAALGEHPTTDAEFEARDRKLNRARRKLNLASSR